MPYAPLNRRAMWAAMAAGFADGEYAPRPRDTMGRPRSRRMKNNRADLRKRQNRRKKALAIIKSCNTINPSGGRCRVDDVE